MDTEESSVERAGRNEPAVLQALHEVEGMTGPFRQPYDYDPTGHIGHLYDVETSQSAFAVPFIGQGLDRDERCLYVGSGNSGDRVVAQLREDRTDVEDALESGTLTTHPVRDLFPPPKLGDPDAMLSSFQELIEAANADESDIRIVVEMTEILEAVPFNTLITYESRLNTVLADANAIALGLYDRDRIPAAELRDIIRTHPYIVAENTVCQNVYYTPPEEMLGTESADEQVPRMIETLVHQTTTHRQLRDLEEQNERLEAFASSLSHDLRTPLQVAIGRADMLADDSEHAEALTRALDRMEELIDDSIEMVRMGLDITDLERASLADLAHDCWDNIDTDAAELTVVGDTAITCDRTRLQQMLENLFENSVEHGGEGASIRVGPIEPIHISTRVTGADGCNGFFVEDDGSGIPPEQRDDIFELGRTYDGGTGYGLAIVENIVKAHDWEIHVSSGTGGGARFEIIGVDCG